MISRYAPVYQLVGAQVGECSRQAPGMEVRPVAFEDDDVGGGVPRWVHRDLPMGTRTNGSKSQVPCLMGAVAS